MSIEIVRTEELLVAADEYLGRMSRSRMNLLVRGQRGRRDMVAAYFGSELGGDDGIRRLLTRAVAEAREHLAKMPHVHLQSEGVPWKFWCFAGRRVEDGMPHTHGGVICLNRGNLLGPIDSLVTTIVHERIHVLQRLQPGFWHAKYVKQGWVPVPDREMGADWRLNPDMPKMQQSQGGDFGVMSFGGEFDGLRGARIKWIEGDGREWLGRWGHLRQQEHPAEIWATAVEDVVRGAAAAALDPIAADLVKN